MKSSPAGVGAWRAQGEAKAAGPRPGLPHELQRLQVARTVSQRLWGPPVAARIPGPDTAATPGEPVPGHTVEHAN